MCPPTILDIGSDSNPKGIFISLEKIIGGCPLPCNVIADVNPFCYPPSNLPENIWYLICTKEDENTKLGNWKVKGEACILFSDSVITGWRTTLEFFEGHAPHEHKTDWLMQEYWITRKGGHENIKYKEASSLCKVFLGGEAGLEHGKQQKLPVLFDASENCIPSSNSVLQKDDNESDDKSTSKHEVGKDDEIGNLAITGDSLNDDVEFPPEDDWVSRGDYLELHDLDTPASSSSSSDNSSCLSMSSDEYFDSGALFRDLETDINNDLVKKDAACKFNVSTPLRPDDLVMLPVSPGPVFSIEGNMPTKDENHRADPVIPGRDNGCKDPESNVLLHTVRNQRVICRNEGPSSICHDVGTSSGSQIASQDGKRKAAKSRMKKLKKKYLCFMPFYFLF